jgi:hypothetical protein
MRKYCFVMILCFATHLSIAQKVDSISKPFSSWSLRFDPLSFFETTGGVLAGFETNLDAKKKLFWISEYEYIFLNSVNLYSSEGNNDNKNTGHVSGFKTKQELRIAVKTKKNNGSTFFAVEVNYLNAGVTNSGWFAMGTPDANGLYPYFKYQDFRETTSETSIAGKFVGKSFSRNRKFNMEAFIGFGFKYKGRAYKKAEGKLVQPDKEPVFDIKNEGFNPYVPIGLRIVFKIR